MILRAGPGKLRKLDEVVVLVGLGVNVVILSAVLFVLAITYLLPS